LAISGRRVQHRDLIEGRRKSRNVLFGEKQDVVLMPIGVSDQCAKRIKPAKLPRIFIG
jgi:hypothetical protein